MKSIPSANRSDCEVIINNDKEGIYILARGLSRDPEGAKNVAQMSAELLHLSAKSKNGDGKNIIKNAFKHTNDKLLEYSKKENLKLGVCVATMVIIKDNFMHIGHMGNNRLLTLKDNQISSLTQEHSIGFNELKKGLLNKKDYLTSPKRNQLTRALGTPQYEGPDTLKLELTENDLFFMLPSSIERFFYDVNKLNKTFEHEPVANYSDLLSEQILNSDKKLSFSLLTLYNGDPSKEKGATFDSNTSKAIKSLKNIPLFRNFELEELLKVLEISKSVYYTKGDHIIEEGLLGEDMFILISGEVEISKNGKPITTLKAGSWFGEMALIDRNPRSATITAKCEVVAVSIERNSLFKVLKKNPYTGMKLFWDFLTNLNKRLREKDQESLEEVNFFED